MVVKEKLIGVQYLRAIAALMVAYYHLALQIPAYTPFLSSDRWINTTYLAGGVPVFFMISGFVMYVSAIESSPARFAWRRLARIVPLYWTLTLSIVLLVMIRPGVLRTEVSLTYIIKSLLFIPYFHPGYQEMIFPILGPGWSLDYEMFFYLLFALALFAPIRWRLPTILLTLAALAAIGLAFPVVKESALGLAYTSGLLLLFATGLVMGWLYREGRLRAPAPLSIALALVGMCALIGSASPGWLRSYVAPTAIVLGVVSLDSAGKTPVLPWLLVLGDASYSIYLVHLFAFDAVEKLWLKLHISGMAPVFATLSLVTAIAMALTTYRLIEKPSVRWLKRIRRGAPRSGPLTNPAI